MEASFKSNHVTVNFEEKSTSKVMQLHNELTQVIINLLKNSVDQFMEVKTENPIINITTEEFDTTCYISLCDNAGGIPEDVINRIFDPFFTTKDIGQGTGMGLDIVKKIINRHKGDIRVESEPGKTIFTVCLPK